MKKISFGTDGWRAIIADDYTFENLTIVAQATARWITEENITSNGVVIGYDARFMGREFAEHTAAVFCAMEVPVRLSSSISPTPAISWAAKHYDAVGIVITASHNPPNYNGFKIKAPFGGSATPDQIAGVESRLYQEESVPNIPSFKSCLKAGIIREITVTEQYLNVLREKIDIEAIKKSGIRIGHDPMFGSGMGAIKKLLGEQVFELHGEVNPSFKGIPPEPIEKNLAEFSEFIPKNNCQIGIANDGDADRIALFDENGTFVDSHRILSLLVKYLHKEKGLSGTIVKTFSTTDMLNKQASEYGLPIEVTPIGFKYIAELIVNGDVIVGGEESGGLSVKGHLPERDGLYIGLLMTEMMVKSGKKLSELVQELFDEFGDHAYYRNDLHTEESKKQAMIKHCKDKKLTKIDGKNVTEWQFTDGIKQILEDGSWLLVRPSGTEPVLRIYAEAPSAEQAKAMVEDVTQMVDQF
ncbi:phosphoglucomutase/phosphomannomutase family protein [Rhodohalobacter sp. SW132]|uniref:phosphoglucomutase/phosphomannomutase family protein n=1 Tax=Rhodohalobacter sp. SW132 TaxID=2293433 RepID=UPI000E25302A|nr:phosphoglucomutase/phosphomannomutase family protein [Rhodohalobacter sp. SW132]REL33118.1 phosphoglucomutase/phosphomannomutase family protein [Rhodohalobacter sp. SW132]